MVIDDRLIVDSLINKSQENIDTEPRFEFDRLKMYFGEPYSINSNGKEIKIMQPTIGDILNFGEKEFYSMLNIFVANPTTYRLQLWDMGLDWNKISDYELFCMLINGLDIESTKLIFGDLDFGLFKLYGRGTDENNKVLTLYNQEQDIEISEEIYKHMAEYLRLMFNIHPKVEKAKGKFTKQSIIDEDRMNLNFEKSKKNVSKSMLLPLISACMNHPGFKYKLSELKEVGIVQFMDSVQRLQIYESTVALMSGMYSGMVDVKGIDKDAFNFMRDIDEK